MAKALTYLASTKQEAPGNEALIGLAFFKGGQGEHPRAVAAVQYVRQYIASGNRQRVDIYSHGLMIIFLREAGGEEYRKDIESLVIWLYERQKSHGGFGYDYKDTGDTSMTQYAVLGLWEAQNMGLETRPDAWERVCGWLMRTQDPSGAWGYQGKDPGTYALTAQDEVRHSLAAAGLASHYVCGDYFGIGASEVEAEEAVPSALKEVQDPSKARGGRHGNINQAQFVATAGLGDAWFANNFVVDPAKNTHYYLYAFERYQTFAYRFAGRAEPKEPKWYTDIADYLINTQTADGSWHGAFPIPADTSFGVLFLMRSSKKSVERADRLGAGTLTGGRGVGIGIEFKKAARPLTGPAEGILNVMDDPNNPEFERALLGLAQLSDEADERTLDKHAARIRQLAGAENADARYAAVAALVKSDNLDNVPTLVYALTDPDPEIVAVAQDGLRKMSRRFAPLPIQSTDPQQALQEEVAFWKSWYRGFRPDAEFAE